MDVVTLALSKNFTKQQVQALKEEIDARSDVVDIVNTYQDLVDYSKPITADDVVKVLHDQAHTDEQDKVLVPEGATGYYRYTGNTSDRWAYIGSVDGYYTKSEVYNKSEVDEKINALDYEATGLAVNKTITSLTEVDGKIAATAEDISIASNQVNDKVESIDSSAAIPTSAAVKTYVDTAIDQLDLQVPITNTAGKTIASVTESNGIIGATFQDIQINESQVNNLVSDLESKLDDTQLKTKWSEQLSDSNIPSEKLVKSEVDTTLVTAKGYTDSEINKLDASVTGSADKTIASITETDGVVSATFQDISIASSQVNDKVDTITESSAIPTSSAVKTYVDNGLAAKQNTIDANHKLSVSYVDGINSLDLSSNTTISGLQSRIAALENLLATTTFASMTDIEEIASSGSEEPAGE